MNRIFTFVIASTLLITGSNIFAQQVPRSPRPVQQTEVIQYAIERASVVPSYRGYRKSNVYVAPKQARSVVLRTYPNVRKQSSLTLSSRSPRQTTKVAPEIYSSSRRVTRSTVTTPVTEIAVSAPDLIEPGEPQINVVKTNGPPQTKLIPIVEAIAISSPMEMPETTEAAPVIAGSSRHITSIAAPTPAVEIAVSALDPIETSQSRLDVVGTETPAKASPDFDYQSLSDYESEALQQSKSQLQSKPIQSDEAIAISSPVQQPMTAEAAPVILSSSRRIAEIRMRTPATELPISAPAPIELAETQSDVVRAESPAKASPNFKYRSPSDYESEDLQQSPLQPDTEQFQREDLIAISSPEEHPWTIDPTDPFEVVAQAVLTDIKTPAVPLKSAVLGSEEESPFTSFIVETYRLPAVETKNTTEAVGPIALATTGLTAKAKAERKTAKNFQASAGEKSSHNKTADIAWWAGLTLLFVPFLALLGWTMFGDKTNQQFEIAPTIAIPLQSNTPWQFQEDTDVQLTLPFASKTDAQEIHCSGEESVALESETELLDEIHSINAIAFDSSSAARSPSNERAESKNN